MRHLSRACAAALAATVVTAEPASAGPNVSNVYVSNVVASGLNNPRGLAFAPDGSLYIAEGGTYNPGGPVTTVPDGPAAYGGSGSITRVANGVQTRIITGLPSLTVISSGSATGPQDIAFVGGVGYVTIGLGANPAVRTGDLGSAPGAANLGSLYSFVGNTVTKVADLAGYEAAANPNRDQIDSNPYHLVAGAGGLLVTDAGGNDALKVTTGGVISTIGTFAGRNIGGGFPSDAVPTGVAVGPDGAYYIGELTGFPFTPGQAQIFRIDPVTLAASIYATGFTDVTDIAWGNDGSLYVLQFADAGLLAGGAGSIQRLNADGSHSTIFAGLIAPTGLEIGRDDAFYVTSFSASPGIGQVLRIGAVPEPTTWAMMLLGFGFVGSAMRRRYRAGAAAA